MADPLEGAVILLPDGQVVRARDLTQANIGPAVLHDEAVKNAIRQLRTPLPDGPRIPQASVTISSPSTQAENVANQTSTGSKRKADTDDGDMSDNTNTHTTTNQNTPRRQHTLKCVHCDKVFSRVDTVRLHLINSHYKKENPDITVKEAQAKSRQEAP
ncbi:hypothetical protein CKAH01_08947 [Colletotrichum kahawae]|uniref:C2H2-type domain-containing protein n=1 Tax=Colletotrichum kahawae TaxID=34407 RepID=A0AAD9XZT2_COLKA|nr:hypothetical protein CKAH01_08947 [Colletotrichum kahawae]